jgi:hypothetical protein
MSTIAEKKESPSPSPPSVDSMIKVLLAKKYDSIFIFENLVIQPNGNFTGVVRLHNKDTDKREPNINFNKP